MTERDGQIASFLARHGWGGAIRRTLADDASFRRYDRLTQDDRTAVLMDAPPEKEDVRPFIAIAEILHNLELSAPALFAQNPEQGFLLLEDFGDDTYTRVLAAAPEREEALYLLAVDLLISLHSRFTSAPNVPAYDDAKLALETDLLLDWYLPAVTGKEPSSAVRRDYAQLWQALFAHAHAIPQTLVLRDYHVDNMLWLPDRTGVAACGLLDFQDAVVGPAAYDLVSLLEDARRDVPGALADAAFDRYLAAFPAIDADEFRTAYAVLGAQRSAKILGIFTRLDRRDGKPDYLTHIPRVWRWLEGNLAHPCLAGLREWFDTHLPPNYRIIPPRMTKP